MLMVIDKSMIDVFKEVDNTKIYNLNTLYEGIIDANELFLIGNKYDDLTIYGTRDFDILYSDIIIKNNSAFKTLFNIIYDLYRNINVCVAVNFDKHGEYMAEALTKLIQQRYEIDATYIYEDEDIPSLKDMEQEFGIIGLYNLDEDKKRYFNLLTDEDKEQIELENEMIENGNK